MFGKHCVKNYFFGGLCPCHALRKVFIGGESTYSKTICPIAIPFFKRQGSLPELEISKIRTPVNVGCTVGAVL